MLTAESLSAPLNVHPGPGACLRVRGHGRAHALAVTPNVAAARVLNTPLKPVEKKVQLN